MRFFVPCLAALTITFFPSVASQPKGMTSPASDTVVRRSAPPSMIVIKALITAYALQYGVEPATALAVAHIESRKGKDEFRVGRAGKYWLPFGIHKCFLSRWRVDDLETNIQVGVSSLKGKDLRRTLRRYNATFDNAYWNAILKAREHYRKEGIS